MFPDYIYDFVFIHGRKEASRLLFTKKHHAKSIRLCVCVSHISLLKKGRSIFYLLLSFYEIIKGLSLSFSLSRSPSCYVSLWFSIYRKLFYRCFALIFTYLLLRVTLKSTNQRVFLFLSYLLSEKTQSFISNFSLLFVNSVTRPFFFSFSFPKILKKDGSSSTSQHCG